PIRSRIVVGRTLVNWADFKNVLVLPGPTQDLVGRHPVASARVKRGIRFRADDCTSGKHLRKLRQFPMSIVCADEIQVAFSQHLVVRAYTVARGSDRTSPVKIANNSD